MAAAIPEVLIAQLLYKIGTKFQGLHPHFRGSATQQDYSVNTLRHRGGWKSKMAAITGSTYEMTHYLSFYIR